MLTSPVKPSSESKDETGTGPPDSSNELASPEALPNGWGPVESVNGSSPPPDLVNGSSWSKPTGGRPLLPGLLNGSSQPELRDGDEEAPWTPKSIEDDESIGLDLTPLTPTTIEHENLTPDTSSQSSDSKCAMSDNEITFLIDNLAVESDHFEKVSTETVDIALLLPYSESEDNERTPEERSKGDEEDEEERSSSSSSNASSIEHENDATEVEAPRKGSCGGDGGGDESPTSVKWGENKRRQSLMMKYTLKNNLENSAKDLLKNAGLADDQLKNGTADAYENGHSLLAPDNEMNTWASSCANLSPVGPRFKLIKEGDVQVCFLDHTRTVISKILSFKFLRYFESQHLYLHETKITPKNVSYSDILFVDFIYLFFIYIYKFASLE